MPRITYTFSGIVMLISDTLGSGYVLPGTRPPLSDLSVGTEVAGEAVVVISGDGRSLEFATCTLTPGGDISRGGPLSVLASFDPDSLKVRLTATDGVDRLEIAIDPDAPFGEPADSRSHLRLRFEWIGDHDSTREADIRLYGISGADRLLTA